MPSTEVTVTLGRAQKLQQGLEEFLAKYRVPRRRPAWALESAPEEFKGTLSEELNAMALRTGAEAIAENLRKKAQGSLRAMEEYFQVAQDRARLKEALFRRNIETGVSESLTRRDLLTDTLERLRTLQGSLEQASAAALPLSELTGERLLSLVPPESTERPRVPIEVRFYEPEDLQGRIDQCRIDLAQLEDEIRSLNATETVSFTLSAVSARLLGVQ